MPDNEHDNTTLPTLEDRVSDLESRVAILEQSRPGRKGRPIQVSEKGVCGLNPECDSATCPDASVYRWQHGCKGEACRQKNSEYYTAYRKAKRLSAGQSVEAQ